MLAGERKDLKETLKQLSLALVDVNSLVKENRGKLRSNVDNIASLAALLAKHKDELEETTINAPTALTNVALAYNGTSGSLDTRNDIPERALRLSRRIPRRSSATCSASRSRMVSAAR